jgi:hypothetical protein
LARNEGFYGVNGGIERETSDVCDFFEAHVTHMDSHAQGTTFYWTSSWRVTTAQMAWVQKKAYEEE